MIALPTPTFSSACAIEANEQTENQKRQKYVAMHGEFLGFECERHVRWDAWPPREVRQVCDYTIEPGPKNGLARSGRNDTFSGVCGPCVRPPAPPSHTFPLPGWPATQSLRRCAARGAPSMVLLIRSTTGGALPANEVDARVRSVRCGLGSSHKLESRRILLARPVSWA